MTGYSYDHLDHPLKPLVRVVRAVRVILDRCLDHYPRADVVPVVLASVAVVALALAATVALIRAQLSRAAPWRAG